MWVYSACIAISQVNADFVFDKDEGCGSVAVVFTDQSISMNGQINEWIWDLGGVLSVKQNPGIIFNLPGEYTICLTVKTSTGVTSKICKEKAIKVYPSPQADFISNINSGCVPATANFLDQSISPNGKITNWLWDIGGTANVINTTDPNLPINTTYSLPGKYTATLSITDEKGCKNTITKPNFVDVIGLLPLRIDFTSDKSCILPLNVQFDNLNVDDEAIYKWDFGNGQSHTGARPPIIAYTEAKAHTVTVFIEKKGCKDSIILQNLIDTRRIVDFSFESTNLCEKQTFKIKENINFEADSVIWYFGDGSISTIRNPEKSFSTPGCYDIKLVTFYGPCVDSLTKSCVVVRPKPEINSNLLNNNGCSVPNEVKFEASSPSQGMYSWHIKGLSLDTMINQGSGTINFTEFGEYQVSLKFVDDYGCIVESNEPTVNLQPFRVSLPQIGFEGCIPFDAPLNNLIATQDKITGVTWSIGTPSIFTSTDINTSFPVTTIGMWDLTLVAENIYGCKDTIFKPDYIKGGDLQVIDFIADPREGCLSVGRNFTVTGGENTDFWTWYSNNSSSFSNEKDPSATFSTSGCFDILLEASFNGCITQLEKKEYIKVFEPVSLFEVTYDCDNPYTIKIQNKSIGADSLYWVVYLDESRRDTIRDSLLSSYTFDKRGLYFLSHYAFNTTTGCEHTILDSIFIVDPEVNYTLDTVRGCAPLIVNLSTWIQDGVDISFSQGDFTINRIDSNLVSAVFDQDGILEGPIIYVTDRHGCIDSFQTSTPVEVSKIDLKITSPNIFCTPDIGTFIDESNPGLVPIVSRLWKFSLDNQTAQQVTTQFNIPTEGFHYVSLYLQNAWGCIDSIKKEIRGVPLDPKFFSDTLSCTSKAIQFQTTTTSNFIDQYKWNFGDGGLSGERNPIHQYNSEGIYNVCLELFDSRGCSKEICTPEKVKIINPKALFVGQPLEAPCPPLIAEFTNLSTNAEKFTWDFGSNSGKSFTKDPTHVYTSPGIFDVTLYAEMIPGCIDSFLIEKYIEVLGPTASMNIDIIGNCTPLEVILSGNSDKLYEYIWDFGDGQIEKVAGLIDRNQTEYTYYNSGTYIPKLLVSDENGCTRTFTLDPIIVNEINVDFQTPLDPLCGIPYFIEFENKSTSTSAINNLTWKTSGVKDFTYMGETGKFTIDAYGYYNITLIVETINCKDSLTQDSIIEIAALPDLNFDILDSLLCANSLFTIVNNTDISYGTISNWLWTIDNEVIATNRQPNLVSENSGSKEVKVLATTNKGCIDSLSKTIEFLPNTLITLPDDHLICIGDSIDIQVSVDFQGNYTQSWEPHPTIHCLTCPIINIKPTSTTTYYHSTITENGCKNIDSIVVTVVNVPGPTLNLTQDTIICNNTSAIIKILNYNPSYDYNWDVNIPGLNCYICPIVRATPDVDTYYKIIVRNQYGCFKEDSVLVALERPIDDFLADNKVICENASTELVVSHGNNVKWQPHPSLSCTNCSIPLATPIEDTYYFVSVLSDLGCPYSDSILVQVIPIASTYAGQDTSICKGEVYILTGEGIGEATWTSSATIETPNQLTSSTQPESSSLYILTTSFGDCVLNDSVYIEVLEKVNFTLTRDTICPDESTTLFANGNAFSYVWKNGDIILAIKEELTLSPMTSLNLTVIGYRGMCTPDTLSTHIHVHSPIEYKLLENKYTIYSNTKEKILAIYNDDNSLSYSWSPPYGLSCINCPTPIIQNINENTTYNLRITDEFGCFEEHKVYAISDNECVKNGFYIPNIFTPYNRDGINDSFRVYAENEEEFISISIYDRWGTKVWYSESIDKTWDGFYNGNKLSQGVYTYIVTAICTTTKQIFNFGGDITVIE